MRQCGYLVAIRRIHFLEHSLSGQWTHGLKNHLLEGNQIFHLRKSRNSMSSCIKNVEIVFNEFKIELMLKFQTQIDFSLLKRCSLNAFANGTTHREVRDRGLWYPLNTNIVNYMYLVPCNVQESHFVSSPARWPRSWPAWTMLFRSTGCECSTPKSCRYSSPERTSLSISKTSANTRNTSVRRGGLSPTSLTSLSLSLPPSFSS